MLFFFLPYLLTFGRKPDDRPSYPESMDVRMTSDNHLNLLDAASLTVSGQSFAVSDLV